MAVGQIHDLGLVVIGLGQCLLCSFEEGLSGFSKRYLMVVSEEQSHVQLVFKLLYLL